jgi:hypothetical protein
MTLCYLATQFLLNALLILHRYLPLQVITPRNCRTPNLFEAKGSFILLRPRLLCGEIISHWSKVSLSELKVIEQEHPIPQIRISYFSLLNTLEDPAN